MVNRILALLKPGDNEDPPYGDFVVVSGPFGSLSVTRNVAREIERVLDRRWRPRWVTFHDRVGSRVRVRANEIRLFVESTTVQRASDRQLDRARRTEEKADRRPWEDQR
jgi:hypothetical protein